MLESFWNIVLLHIPLSFFLGFPVLQMYISLKNQSINYRSCYHCKIQITCEDASGKGG